MKQVKLISPPALIIFAIALMASSLLALSVPAVGWFLSDTLAVRPMLIGSFFVCSSLTAVFYNQIIGFWSDWLSDGRRVVAGSLMCGAFACWGFVWLENYSGLLLVSTVFFSLSLAAFGYTLSLVYQFLEQADEQKRNKLQMMMQACLAIAWSLGPALGALILAHADYSELFFGMGVVFCFIALSALMLLPNIRRAPILVYEETPISERVPAALYTVIFVVLYAVNHAYLVSFPLYLQGSFSVNMLDISSMYAVAALMQIPVFFIISRFTRKLSLIMLSLIAVLMSMLLNLGVWLSSHLWQLYLLQAVVALFIGFVSSAGFKWFQSRLVNSGMAPMLHSNAILMGSVIGGICMALGAESRSYQFVFTINLVMCGIAFVLLLLITRFSASGFNADATHGIRTDSEKKAEQNTSQASQNDDDFFL